MSNLLLLRFSAASFPCWKMCIRRLEKRKLFFRIASIKWRLSGYASSRLFSVNIKLFLLFLKVGRSCGNIHGCPSSKLVNESSVTLYLRLLSTWDELQRSSTTTEIHLTPVVQYYDCTCLGKYYYIIIISLANIGSTY